MKKLLLTLSIAMTIISCENKTDGTTNDLLDNSAELTQEEKDASYAFGISLGQATEQQQANPAIKDSLDYDLVKEGIEDYLKSPEKKESYLVGANMGKQINGALSNDLMKGHLSKDEIIKGMMDYLNKKELKVSKDSTRIIMDKFYNSRIASQETVNVKEGVAFMNKIKKESDVITTPSGLAYKVVQEGNGTPVVLGDKVMIKYTGKTLDGEVFDSTDKNSGGEAIELPITEGSLIPGWIEGLQLMSKGGKYILYIPAELAYGNQQSGPIGPGETLIFDIEVVDVNKSAAE